MNKKMKSIMAIAAAVCLCTGVIAGCSGKDEEKAVAETTETVRENQEAESTESGTETESDVSSETGTEVLAEKGAEGAEKEEKGEEAGGLEKGEEGAGEAEILLAAAASLKNAFEEELIPMFQEKYPRITVKGTYDSSGKLQTQIEEGMEADVFMSAAKKQMTALEEEGWIASETMVDLLENKIVLIVPAGDEDKFSSFEDIRKAGQVAIGDPESVPAGQYAREALTSLGIWEEVLEKASLGTNVTEVLNQVAAASAEAGIVYATDAASMPDKVCVVAEAPEGSLSQKVIYPVAVVKNTAHREAAEAFVEFLSSPEAMEVFVSYGFAAAD